MILGLARMLIVLLVLLTVVYLSLFFYWRSGIKMRLEEDWVMAGRPGDREAWINERLAPAARRMRAWLIAMVYALPIITLSVYVYITN